MKLRSLVAAAFLLSTLSLSALAASFSAGINISEDASPEQTGLRIYPGATVVVKNKGNDATADIQFSFGEYGLKVVVAKLRTSDAPSKVAEFYRNELKQFGEILDCSTATTAAKTPAQRDKSKTLTCDGKKPSKGGMLYKAGQKDDQRTVEIKSMGEGSEFSLVYVRVRSPD